MSSPPPAMRRAAPVEGFSLAYEQVGSGPAVVAMHGWPGDHRDWREVAARVAAHATVVMPDLRGFGETDGPAGEPDDFAADAQARSVAALIGALGAAPAVVAGYDVGSRVAQALARAAPELVRALVIAPPLPGVGDRVLSAQAQTEFWYQAFHRLELSTDLLDGRREAVRRYLEHFWRHWSGPGYEPDASELDRLAGLYGRPGAFAASINWYRAGAGTVARSLAETAPAREERIATPTTVLWPEHDPLFPPAWADRVAEFFAAAEVQALPGAGHFSPLEAPERVAGSIIAALS